QDRPIVLLDEPFAALGPAMRAEMLALVAEVLQGRTVLMVTHDPTDLRRIGGGLIVVADGSVSAPAPALEMLDNPPPALRDYLGQGQ
ncbi:MAG: thiamine ABC transporter ATP-binding protein, partial [Rhodobacteraceae bacterium]|nr:thiamine ABC transporter ATP-binding protein [Paracoccaceae bacterium]